jgi:hypothetical protein
MDTKEILNKYIVAPSEMIDIALEEGIINEEEATECKLGLVFEGSWEDMERNIVGQIQSNKSDQYYVDKLGYAMSGIKDTTATTASFGEAMKELPGLKNEITLAASMQELPAADLVEKKVGTLLPAATSAKFGDAIVKKLSFLHLSPEVLASIKGNPLSFFSHMAASKKAMGFLTKIMPSGKVGEMLSGLGAKLAGLSPGLQAGVLFAGLLLGGVGMKKIFGGIKAIFGKIAGWFSGRKPARRVQGEGVEFIKNMRSKYALLEGNDKKIFRYFSYRMLSREHELNEANLLFGKMIGSKMLVEAVESETSSNKIILGEVFESELQSASINEGVAVLTTTASTILLGLIITLAYGGTKYGMKKMGYDFDIMTGLKKIFAPIKAAILGKFKKVETDVVNKDPEFKAFYMKIKDASVEELEQNTETLKKEYERLKVSEDQKVLLVKIISEKFGDLPVRIDRNGKPTISKSYKAIKEIMGIDEAMKAEARMMKVLRSQGLGHSSEPEVDKDTSAEKKDGNEFIKETSK